MEPSTKSSSGSVEQRVEKLEKANRRITWVALAFGAMLILMFALAATKTAAVPDVIRAKRLEIVDDKGNSRISLQTEWSFSEHYRPILRMYDDKGKSRAELNLTGNEPGLFLYDEKGKELAGLSVFQDKAGLGLFDGSGAPRAWLSAHPDGGTLGLLGEKGKVHPLLTVDADGTSLKFLDKDGKTIWQAPK